MCLYITGHLNTTFTAEHRKEVLRYIYNNQVCTLFSYMIFKMNYLIKGTLIDFELQNEDGGWGLHIESHSNMYSTTFNYVCMRILGEEADGDACARARKWILDHGGVTLIPSWGKIWLSVQYNFCSKNATYISKCLLFNMAVEINSDISYTHLSV
jgi:beta-amyrin synthase